MSIMVSETVIMVELQTITNDNSSTAVMRNCSKSQDDIAIVTSLKACTRKKDLRNGMLIHADILKNGLLKRNVIVGNSLITMYVKCNALTKARDVFDELLIQDVVSWNVLISGYVRSGHCLTALNCFQQMFCEGISPDPVTFACALKACGNTRAARKGCEIHSQILGVRLLEKDMVLGSALVDMYAKCGTLLNAKMVLGELPARNSVCWNALITGYTKQGLGEEALVCFNQMQCEGVHPDETTLTSVLKACGIMRAVEEGEEIHAEIVRRGLLEGKNILGNAIVDMYAKCGSLSKAQNVLDEIPVHNVVTWNTLIAGYIEHDQNEEALYCFERMQGTGLSPDPVTLTSVLKVCGSIGAIEKGEELTTIIMREGLLDRDHIVGNALVDMYIKCGAFTRAKQVFDKLPRWDVISWNILISGCVQQDLTDEAFVCFEKMQCSDYSPDATTYVCLLKACCNIGDACIGQKLHCEIIRREMLGKDNVIGNALVDMYAKCGAFTKSREIFDEFRFRDLIAYNSLISGCSIHGKDEEATYWFERMQQEALLPDATTFTCTLKTCSGFGGAHRGREIHAMIFTEGFLTRSIELGTALVNMYSETGHASEALKVFNELPEKNTVSWNILMEGHAQNGHGHQALQFFEQMKSEGHCPDTVTYSCALNCCGDIGATEKGKQLHAKIVRLELLQESAVLGNALVDMYAKCEALTSAQKVFDELPVRDVVSWNVLIGGYSQQGYIKAALSCFERMQSEGPSPDDVTITCVLKACSSIGISTLGRQIHRLIAGDGFILKSSMLNNTLVDMYAKCGEVSKAHKLFDELEFRDVVSWTVLIGGYSQLGDYETVIRLYNKMIQENTAPDLVTITVLLKACNQSGLVDDGERYFEFMSSRYGIVPTLYHQTCMVTLFGRTGQFNKAISAIKGMCLDHPPLWFSLLDSCKKWGNVKLGKLAFDQALRLYNMSHISAGNCVQPPH